MANKKEIYGALMRISRSYDSTSVQMITGITTDSDLNGMELKELFSGNDVSLEKYQEYHNHLELAKRRTTLYKGSANLTPGILTLSMQSEDRAGSILVLRLPLVESVDNKYFGSIGLTTLISDANMQILKMGVVRADQKGLVPFSLTDEQLPGILAINKLENEHIELAFRDNALWNDMILSSAK